VSHHLRNIYSCINSGLDFQILHLIQNASEIDRFV
jgi:hypothetical protein